jgi:AraC-like DNA-binding protein
MKQILEIKSIDQLHRLMQLKPPLHPLVSVVRHSAEMNVNFAKNIRVNNHLYFISLKENIQGAFQYGRKSYDFQEGSLVFIRPGQIAAIEDDIEPDVGGWSIFFHPDLIQKHPLSKSIRHYSFFDYAINEALHISEKEKKSLAELVAKIEYELDQNIDQHTQELIIHLIETVLKYSQRYFDRQFFTRKIHHHEVLERFEAFLNQYFENHLLTTKGIPTVQSCGESMNMSGKYLSDLLKKETGKSLMEIIYLHIIEKAKIKLLNSTDPINQIAFDLGFMYPQHFSHLFKKKTGLSPKEFREIN